MIRVHLHVYGHVQGVFFRQSSKERACELGLRGWVRNRRSGAVEMVAEGSEEDVDALVTWCHNGPAAARVDRVERIDGDPAGLPEGFHVRPTE
jgi:acylphosphatase